MAKDDIVLGVELGKLEIESIRLNKTIKEENPFTPVSLTAPKKSVLSRTCPQPEHSCGSTKNSHLPICKKKARKLVKDPILKLFQKSQSYKLNEDCTYGCSKKILTPVEGSDILNLCALVDNCNQLRISSGGNERVVPEQNDEKQWWKTKPSAVRQSRELTSGASQAGSCSQQALNPPCDVTIDELASYFETLVHIPKKMSSMAEMMYI